MDGKACQFNIYSYTKVSIHKCGWNSVKLFTLEFATIKNKAVVDVMRGYSLFKTI